MLIDVTLPELAESLVEGEVVRWLVAPGDSLHADQPLLEVMTDKVTVELPTPLAGVLHEIVASPGTLVPVGGLLARVAPAAPAGEQPPSDAALFRAAETASSPPLPIVVKRTRPAPPLPPAAPPRGAYGRLPVVPAARRRARELGLRLESLLGSGPHGRVRLEDVKPPQAPMAAPWPAPPPVVTPSGYAAREQRVPLRGVRRRITEQLVASHLYTVRTLHVDEADMGALLELRAAWQAEAAGQGVKLSVLPFILKALALVLPRYPALRSALDEAAGEVVIRTYSNLGVAVDTAAGLLVPVVRDVDEKSLLQVASELQQLAASARDGSLSADALRGGSFTVTNIGSIGGLFSFPIIHAPEAAILGVHSVRKRAVVTPDDRIVARPMLYLSLSFDHRLIDGADAARFTRELIEVLQNPGVLPLR